MKKYSWIVALLMALTFSALFVIGCGVDPIEMEMEEEDFIEVELGAFNTWGGADDKQQGWATTGLVFKGVGDKPETAKDLGYKIEDFKNAKYLVLELASGQPSDGLRLIWGNDEGSGGGWNTGMVMTDARVLDPSALLDGTTLTINLEKCLPDYNKYKASSEEAGLRLVLQYWNQGIAKLGIKSAKLLIPDAPVPFVPIKANGIKLATSTFLWTNELALSAVFDPEDASAQSVIWSIMSFTDASSTTYTSTADLATLKTKAGFKVTPASSYDEIESTDTSYWPWEDDIITVPVPAVTSKTTITATERGTIVVQAFVKDGTDVKEADVGTTIAGFEGSGTGGAVTDDDVGKPKNYIQNVTVTVNDPPALSVKVNGTVQSVLYYSAEGGSMTIASDKFTYTTSGAQNYQGNYAAFRVNLGKALSTFSKVEFVFNGIKGDTGYKQLQLWASNNPITGGQWSSGADLLVGQQPAGEGNGRYEGPTGDEDMEIVLDSTTYGATLAGVTNNVVWFVIYCPGGGSGGADGASFAISGIDFVD